MQRPRSRPVVGAPAGVDHHRFVHLHLPGAVDPVVVRLDAQRIFVLIVAGDRATRVDRTRFEYRTSRAVARP